MVQNSSKEIRIAAAAILRSDGHMLLVRKQSTEAFMQAGGKLDAGEDGLAALIRELHEELGLVVSADEPIFIGHFSAPAANEKDHVVIADVFLLYRDDKFEPMAELAEIRWMLPQEAGQLPLAPLTRDYIIPAILARLAG